MGRIIKLLLIVLVCYAGWTAYARFRGGRSVGPQTGGAAPEIEVTNTKGRTVALTDFAGEPVVINFWATWCPPCRAELPVFDKLAKEYRKKISFMMIDLGEEKDKVTSFVKKGGFSFPVYFDPLGKAGAAYSVRAIPQTVVIDADGNVAATHVGSLNEKTLRGLIAPVLGR